ncbi:MAG: hypothetical protein KAJ76_00990 [Candidatus Heimdallarchaeota archaeon]|nr:hypothetical protein [Candidatus Heimdallarchaeota archaeon]MCK5297449.1 hypothetical protein [Candidatus Heimdallarchaeota archaeon]
MSFVSDRKKQLMRMLIAGSALIPIYVIYITFASEPLPVGIFTFVYSIFIVITWFLFYFDFFIKKPTFNGTTSNGNPSK